MHRSTDLNEWLRYIEAIHPTEIELGLERLKRVATELLQKTPPTVMTVAGTNGKGTTSAAIAALCQSAGAKVGLYTSPHLFRFNERIRINNEPVADQLLVEAFQAVEQARGDVSLSYFEYTTLAAFWVFEHEQLDAWVLEIGLGGRLDAVNLIDPDIAVVTNVGLDHQGFLGDTLEEIGREKAGICRTGRPLVLGSEVPESVLNTAQSVGAELYPFGQEHGLNNDRLYWKTGETRQSALGLPRANAAAALQAFALSPWSLPVEECASVLQALSVPGRLQSFQHQGRRVIVDVGHNPHAAAYIASQLLPERFHVALGMLADKDSDGFIRALQPAMLSLSTVSLNVPRGLTAQALGDRTTQPVLCQADTIEELMAVLDREHPGEPLFIGGSFYTVCAAMDFLEK
ncbi:bifunctional folylpolyglutamate synthase/dihydrofolate synthase [Reinekea blandensis]|uniref:Dihydrofolate synthase/folylpolyglutamate synthase n=1 Tax=Reinekea blandensis MED297 TaxID=314283 RepID=A4BHC7_9GAMM|nr:folylpolyglutamate synthase/dihydrofolate synthase family protein [Reinekea blandensis]EAR08475.1 FolC bifunctional folylpolyglutamate synthase/dihydrofolate synthase [Reinekea sp. MED297] [Reinekea blandensis MED297]